ncbi:MAG: biotin transporter BioY, partial [Gemmatimonadetes bacterium]
MNQIGGTLRAWAGVEVVRGRPARRTVALAAAVVATALSAHVAVPLPFTPVPMTLQPLMVLLAGLVLGPRLGATAMVAYVALGAAGAPVFSNGHGGLAWLLGPTGGYLLAYPAAAFAAGALAGSARAGAVRLFLAGVAGVAVLYAGGVSQLVLVTGQPVARALALGAVPFLFGDLLKVLIALVVA